MGRREWPLSWSVSHFSDYLVRSSSTDEPISYQADEGELLFTNNLNTALDAVKNGGTITVYDTVTATDVGTTITGDVIINGPGTINASRRPDRGPRRLPSSTAAASPWTA